MCLTLGFISVSVHPNPTSNIQHPISVNLLLVEDNTKLREALQRGLEATTRVQVVYACARGEAALVREGAEQGVARLCRRPSQQRHHRASPP